MNSAHSSSAATHKGPPHAHHWDPVTAYSGAKLGMWLFLATEILLFSVMFSGFALYRYFYLDEFHEASKHVLDWKLGALNTVVLLFSSYTAALAVDDGQHGNNKGVVRNFSISILCGLIFMVVKAFEYHHKYADNLMPSGLFPTHSAHFEHYKNFLGFYFCMTGLHGLHVLIGMGLMIWVSIRASRNRFSEDYYTPVELTALYWHLVDLIWIYLFPLLYLVG